MRLLLASRLQELGTFGLESNAQATELPSAQEFGSQDDDVRSEHSWDMVSRPGGSEHGSAGDLEAPGSPAMSTTLSEGMLAAEAFAFSSADEAHSDADTHRTDDLLRRGEPDLVASTFSGAGDAADCSKLKAQGSGRLEPVMESPRGPVSSAVAKVSTLAKATGDTAGRLVAVIAHGLRALVARVKTYVAQRQPAVHALSTWMSSTVQELARSLRVHLLPGSKLSGLTVAASDLSAAIGQRACTMACRAKRGLELHRPKHVDWTKAALVAGCTALAAMLYRSGIANAKLAARLNQREGELAELVSASHTFTAPCHTDFLRN